MEGAVETSNNTVKNDTTVVSNSPAVFYSTTCKLFEAERFKKLNQGIKVAACMISDTLPITDEASVVKQAETLTEKDASRNSGGCTSCNAGPFESRVQQTAHYKHHWHTYNLRRRLLGRPPISLFVFNSRDGDSSSVSDSDSDSEAVNNKGEKELSPLFLAATRHCRAYFTNSEGNVFSVYRCLLHHKKEFIRSDGTGDKLVKACKDLTHEKGWAVIMCAGGHFAAAIFRGESDVAIKHRALHSYVTRRGQGKAQGTRDARGNAPRSAGASLRRYNQEQFAQHVQEVLIGWKEELTACSLILYRAVGPLNKASLFGSGSPLYRQDPRLRTIPFPTRRPTFKEVRRAHSILATVEIYESFEVFQKAFGTTNNSDKNSTNDRVTGRKAQKASPSKTIDRAKSREKNPRPTPGSVTFSEDEGPCYEQWDSMGLPNWTKTLADYDKSIKSVDKISEPEVDIKDKNELITNIEDKNLTNNTTDMAKKMNKKKVPKKVNTINPKEDQSNLTDNNVAKNTKLIDSQQKTNEVNKNKKSVHSKKSAIKVPSIIQKLWDSLTAGETIFRDTIEKWNGSISIEESLNIPDPKDGNTALHKAAIAELPDVVTHLLELGADPCLKNVQLQTPYCATNHQDTRIAFRLFQGLYPDKYQYAKASIPGPLTSEIMEQEKEKKAAQRRAKKLKDREKQQEKTKVSKFLELNDKQKIATIQDRCFTCGSAIKSAPFTYEEYKFCNIKCLQHHRNARPLKLSAQ